MKILLLILLFSAGLFAQDSTKYAYGIKAGITFAHIEGASVENKGNINNPMKYGGSTIGIFFSNKINEWNTLQSDIYYISKNAGWGRPLIPIIGYDGDYAFYNLKFFGLSIVNHLKSRIGNLLKNFDFSIGVFYEYTFFARQKWVVEIDGPGPGEFPPQDFLSQVNPHQLGFIFGLRIPFFTDLIKMNLFWHFNLTQLYDMKEVTYAEYDFTQKDNMKIKTFSISFQLTMHKFHKIYGVK